MHRSTAECPEDQEIKRALQNVESRLVACHWCRPPTASYAYMVSNVNNTDSRWCVDRPPAAFGGSPPREGETRAKRARGSLTHHLELQLHQGTELGIYLSLISLVGSIR